MRRMLDQTMAWIIGISASTMITGGIVYGLNKIHVSDEHGSSDGHGDPHANAHKETSDHASDAHAPTEPKGEHGDTEGGHGDAASPSDPSHDAAKPVEPEHADKEQEHAAPDEHGSNHDKHSGLKLAAKSPADSHGAHWKYEGDTGPDRWGDLSAEFSKCSEGKTQSPIDFKTLTPSDRDMPVEFHYRDATVSWHYNGHALQADYSPGSYIVFEKKRYQLKQFHFHTPSEHTIHGENYPAEVHFVHKDDKGNLAVVGMMIKNGDQNDAFQDFIDKIPRQANKPVKVGPFSADRILPAQGFYYAYEGSLTTPPCSENVKWIVMKQPIEMSSRQITALSNITGSNARPTQPLHSRKPRIEGVEANAH
jgi:carbonic anhydrase